MYMYSICLGQINRCLDIFDREGGTVRNLREEVEGSRRVIKSMKGLEDCAAALEKILDAMDMEEQGIHKAAAALERCSFLYRNGERNVDDRVEGGMVIYPHHEVAEMRTDPSYQKQLEREFAFIV